MARLTLRRSIGTQLAIANGVMLGGAILVMSAVFYFATVSGLNRDFDRKILSVSDRLFGADGARPPADLVREIDRALHDGVDSDYPLVLLTSPSGDRLAGNMSMAADDAAPRGRLVDRDVIRNGVRSPARLIIRTLPGGGRLYVGRDLDERRTLRRLVWRALRPAAAIALALVILVAFVFHRQIEARIGHIRHTARHIEAGNLKSRIRISGDDEFARLSVDINRMLDRMEQLVDGVRDVSNAIAHDLRTPLMRIRGRLDDALRGDRDLEGLSAAACAAMDDIDELVQVFNKLLQIAEAESGLRAESFQAINLSGIVQDMAELYDATAEEKGVKIHVGSRVPVWASGDHDLLANAVASLIDNAIKYAGPDRRVELFAFSAPDGVWMVVQDNGRGVPQDELPRLAERFYRLDRARSRPGNGLGLGIVSAIATLHGGKLVLANTAPGFRASIVLPTFQPPGQTDDSRPQPASALPVL